MSSVVCKNSLNMRVDVYGQASMVGLVSTRSSAVYTAFKWSLNGYLSDGSRYMPNTPGAGVPGGVWSSFLENNAFPSKWLTPKRTIINLISRIDLRLTLYLIVQFCVSLCIRASLRFRRCVSHFINLIPMSCVVLRKQSLPVAKRNPKKLT